MTPDLDALAALLDGAVDVIVTRPARDAMGNQIRVVLDLTMLQAALAQAREAARLREANRVLERLVIVSNEQTKRVEAQVAALRGALEPFASGVDWGAIKAWIVGGAPERPLGLKIAAQLTRWQVAADAALDQARGGAQG